MSLQAISQVSQITTRTLDMRASCIIKPDGAKFVPGARAPNLEIAFHAFVLTRHGPDCAGP